MINGVRGPAIGPAKAMAPRGAHLSSKPRRRDGRLAAAAPRQGEGLEEELEEAQEKRVGRIGPAGSVCDGSPRLYLGL